MLKYIFKYVKNIMVKFISMVCLNFKCGKKEFIVNVIMVIERFLKSFKKVVFGLVIL